MWCCEGVYFSSTPQELTLGHAMDLQPVVVRDAHSINTAEESILLSFNESIKAFRARFFHALEAHLQVDGELLAGLLVGFNDIEPA